MTPAKRKPNPRSTNRGYRLLAIERLEELLLQAQSPGFFGQVRVEVTSQNGILQLVDTHVERTHKLLE